MSIINRVKLFLSRVLSKPINEFAIPVLRIAVPVLTALSFVFPSIALATLIINAAKSGLEGLSHAFKSWDKALLPKDAKCLDSPDSKGSMNEFRKKLANLNTALIRLESSQEFSNLSSRYIIRELTRSKSAPNLPESTDLVKQPVGYKI